MDAPNVNESFVAFIQWISRKIGDSSPDVAEVRKYAQELQFIEKY